MSEQHPVPQETDPVSQQPRSMHPPLSEEASRVDPGVADPATNPEATQARHYELPSGHFGFLVYNLLRIGLLLVVGGILFLFGLRSYLLVLVAVVISGMISMVVLSRRRDAAVISLGEVYRRVNDRMDARTRAEDD